MTLKVIAPFLSCVAHAGFKDDEVDERQEAIEAGYSIIHLVTKDGLFIERRFPPGRDGQERFVRIKSTSIPKAEPRIISESYSFLPDGKVPYSIYLTVEKFFKKVIEVRKSSVEAVCFVLWTEEKGYFLFVPDQTVGGASASYSPAALASQIPEGSIIVADIHSHANMGAFFSGTDNNDDSKTIRYSGVFGHNSRPTPETVWRFNCLDRNWKVEMTDIFDAPPMPEVEVEEGWLDKVAKHSYKQTSSNSLVNPLTAHGSQGTRWGRHGSEMPGPTTPGSVWRNGEWVFTDGRATPTLGAADAATRHNFHDDVNIAGVAVSKKDGRSSQNTTQMAGVTASPANRERVKASNLDQSSSQRSFAELSEDEAFGIPANFDSYFNGDAATQAQIMARMDRANPFLPADDESPDDISDATVLKLTTEGVTEYVQEGVTQTWDGITVHIPSYDIPPDFNFIAGNHGIQAALAAVVISKASEDLIDSGSVLTDAITELFQIVPEENKLNTFRKMADILNKADREKLETNGL